MYVSKWHDDVLKCCECVSKWCECGEVLQVCTCVACMMLRFGFILDVWNIFVLLIYNFTSDYSQCQTKVHWSVSASLQSCLCLMLQIAYSLLADIFGEVEYFTLLRLLDC